MDKRWVSQLVTDSAFPMLVLALAVSQIKLGTNKNVNLPDYRRHPTELLPSDDHLSRNFRIYGLPDPSKTAEVAERPTSIKEGVQH
jgi:hypothetical protein